MRTIVFALLIAALGCQGDSSDAHIRKMMTGVSTTGGADEKDYTFEFEMPKGWSIEKNRTATLVDQNGRSFRWTTLSISQGSSHPDRMRGSFRLPLDSRPALLRLDEYEIDLRNSRVKKVTSGVTSAAR